MEIRSPHATRPWQHVLEPLSGYLWLGAKLFAAHRDAVKAGKGDGCHEGFRLDGEAFNFGPSSDASHTVADVVQSLESQWSGFGSKMDLAGQAGMKECTLLKLCCDKALACLNWRATLDFDTTMRFTAKWYEVFYREQGADIYAFTQSQIQDYCRKAAALGCRGVPMESVINDVELLDLAVIPTDGRPGHAYDAPGLPAVRGDRGSVLFRSGAGMREGMEMPYAPDAAFCRACGAAEDCPV